MGLVVEREGQVYRFDVEAFANFSSCNFAKLTADIMKLVGKLAPLFEGSGLEIKKLR